MAPALIMMIIVMARFLVLVLSLFVIYTPIIV
jgi:hypothetical protein